MSGATHPYRVPVSPEDVLDAGVTALGDDACELGGPSRVHLDPLGLGVILSTPRPIVVVILSVASLSGTAGRLSVQGAPKQRGEGPILTPTCMLSRPRCAPRPWRSMEEARIWLSSMRCDSIPMGGHSGDTAPQASGPLAPSLHWSLPSPNPEWRSPVPTSPPSGGASWSSSTPAHTSPPWASASTSGECAEDARCQGAMRPT